MSIAHLRKQRGSFEDLAKKIDSQQKGGTERKEDERLWQCGTDENGNGSAVIRFLPAVEGEEFPYIRMWTHGFKGPGGWYIENSRTTLGEKDPVEMLAAA